MSDHTGFEELVLPHLDANNLARWLTRDVNDAEDGVQAACVRALKYVGSLNGGGARAWFLTIVRHRIPRLVQAQPSGEDRTGRQHRDRHARQGLCSKRVTREVAVFPEGARWQRGFDPALCAYAVCGDRP